MWQRESAELGLYPIWLRYWQKINNGRKQTNLRLAIELQKDNSPQINISLGTYYFLTRRDHFPTPATKMTPVSPIQRACTSTTPNRNHHFRFIVSAINHVCYTVLHNRKISFELSTRTSYVGHYLGISLSHNRKTKYPQWAVRKNVQKNASMHDFAVQNRRNYMTKYDLYIRAIKSPVQRRPCVGFDDEE